MKKLIAVTALCLSPVSYAHDVESDTGAVIDMDQVQLCGFRACVRYTGKIREYHPDGSLKSEVTVVDGQPHGLATAWHANGQKEAERNFVDGEPDGLETTWDESGQLVAQRDESGQLVAQRDHQIGTHIGTQVAEGLNLAAGAKAAVTEYYLDLGQWPTNNETAGLAPADDIDGWFTESVTVEPDGKIVVLFGNESDAQIQGSTLIMSATANAGSGYSSLSWSCASPDIHPSHLPSECQ